jgi:vitamin B12/bleomycin/antimicrobial peptide transport system ATP-binding/permease protein
MSAVSQREGLSRADIDAARSFWGLSRGWWSGQSARQAWFWTLLLAAVILINVGVNVLVNRWHGWFFDALEKKDAATAATAIMAFPAIVLAAAGVGVLILKARETLQVYWRQWLSGSLVDMWVTRRRFQRLGPSGLEPANPEYRIADDVRWATEPLVDFAIGLLSAVVTIVTFIGILWSIGGGLRVGAGEGAFTIPAYLVLAAIIYGVTVSALMLYFGRRLPKRYEERNAQEARFRYGLMRLRDSADAIAIGGGQASERRAIDATYQNLALGWLAVIRERAKLTWITNGSGVLVPIVPLLLAAPKYLSGEMSLGGVMQVAAAFVQVQIAFNWVLDNYMRIAEWLASARRVNDLAQAVNQLESLPPDVAGAPKLAAGAAGRLTVHQLALCDRDGRPLAEPVSFELKAGQSLHLAHLSPEAASAVIRAVADQWSWGAGLVVRADSDAIGAAARRMRFAETALSDVVGADPQTAQSALAQAGLGHLAARTGDTADWDKALTEAERQRLAIARLHATQPRIVLIDDALYALSNADAAAVFAGLRASLPDAMFITAGSASVYAAAADLSLRPSARGLEGVTAHAAPSLKLPARRRKTAD